MYKTACTDTNCNTSSQHVLIIIDEPINTIFHLFKYHHLVNTSHFLSVCKLFYMWNMSCTVQCALLAVFGDKCRQQVSIRRLRSLTFQFENSVDCRRTKEKVVTESHQTGGKPVQSHRLGGIRNGLELEIQSFCMFWFRVVC